MRTHKVFSAAAAALALFAAAGCCGTNNPDSPPSPEATVVVVAAPAPAPAPAVKSAVFRPNRWPLRRRCDRPADCCQCAVQGIAAAPAVVVAAPAEPVKAVAAAPQVLVVEPAKKDAAGKTVTVLRRGRRGRILCNDGRIVVVKPAAAPVAVVSEPAFVEPIVIPEPVVVAVEPAVEEASWTKYLAPEQPTLIAAEPYTLPVEPTAQFIASEPYAVAVPAPVSVPAYAGQRPIVIQPIIQPVVQTGQELMLAQAQVQTAPVAMTQPFVTFQPAQPYAPPAVLPPVAVASAAPAAPQPPVVLAVPPAAAQDKYGALTPAAPAAPAAPARPAERPEVSMPAPLGQTTTPRVAGTDEIENALDVMMGNAPALK